MDAWNLLKFCPTWNSTCCSCQQISVCLVLLSRCSIEVKCFRREKWKYVSVDMALSVKLHVFPKALAVGKWAWHIYQVIQQFPQLQLPSCTWRCKDSYIKQNRKKRGEKTETENKYEWSRLMLSYQMSQKHKLLAYRPNNACQHYSQKLKCTNEWHNLVD